jgi:hypothetical protein
LSQAMKTDRTTNMENLASQVISSNCMAVLYLMRAVTSYHCSFFKRHLLLSLKVFGLNLQIHTNTYVIPVVGWLYLTFLSWV